MASKLVTLALAGLAAGLGWVAWDRYCRQRIPVAAPSPELIGRYEVIERGALIAAPAVTGTHIFLAAIRDTGLQPTGAVICLDRTTRKPLWTFDDGGAMLHMFSSPTVAGDTVYIGEGMHANFECKLYAIDAATGVRRWTIPVSSHIESTPTVANGTVYFGAGDQGMVAADAATGRRLWRLETPAHIDTTPVVNDETVYCGSGVSQRVPAEPAVFALNAANGSTKWRIRFDLPVWASPHLDGDTLYVGLGNGRLTEGPRAPETARGAVAALAASDGALRWRYDDCDAVFGPPAANDRLVFAGSRDGKCHAIDRATGRRAWVCDFGSPIVAGPVWAGNNLVVCSSTGLVRGLRPADGSILWQFDVAAVAHAKPRVFSPPAVASDAGRSVLYLCTELQTPTGNAAVLYILGLK